MARYHYKEARKQYQVTCTRDLVRYCRLQMGHLGDEQFRVLFLNNRNRIIRDEVLQEGTVDRAEVYPRKILEKALKYKASAMILVHNHPSGSPEPSDQDKKLTKTLVKTARDLGITVHDHMIVAREHVYSFREQGLMGGK
jgi:DNA repair protein RadC